MGWSTYAPVNEKGKSGRMEVKKFGEYLKQCLKGFEDEGTVLVSGNMNTEVGIVELGVWLGS